MFCVGSAMYILIAQLLKTPSHYAAEHGHVNVLKYLFDYVAKKLTPSVVAEVS